MPVAVVEDRHILEGLEEREGPVAAVKEVTTQLILLLLAPTTLAAAAAETVVEMLQK
jgi:hypothetical protein